MLAEGNIGPLIAVLVLGMCLGFLPWNVHPAKIFMGDGGALLLGLLMAASTMVVGGRTDQPFSGQTFFFFAPVLIPLVILGVPIFDTAGRSCGGARTRTGPTTADKDHLHHRLMRLGHGHRRSVFILWGWTALLSGFVLYPTYTHSATRSSRSASWRSAWCSTRCCTHGSARPTGPTPRPPADRWGRPTG